ncbi:hypothetical protein KAR91_78065 [Candidatus Pacearchaeota archaeon]|nr:hypothetical protein [Candidatus Pacearchaeota archaeon]
MPFLSLLYNTPNSIQRHKAPSGLMYDIKAITYTVLTKGANSLLITDRYMEEGAVINDDFISVMPTNENVLVQQLFPDGQLCKNISLRSGGATAFSVLVVIDFQFVKATVKDLVLEFITRGKSP